MALIGLALMMGFCGCARQYLIKFNNGNTIVVNGKPKLKGNSYYWKDPNGEVQRVSEGSVALIEPASMAKDQKKTFTPETLR